MSRYVLIERLRKDLIGPHEENEVLTSYPSDIYLSGILFPQKSSIAEDDRDQLQAEGAIDVESGDVSRDEISLAAIKRPASAGISFVVESLDDNSTINITIKVAIYEKEIVPDEDESCIIKYKWQRKQRTSQLNDIILNFKYPVDFDDSETGIDGIGIHIRTSVWENKKLVTVALINLNTLEKDSERTRYEELCFFQTELIITTKDRTSFSARPVGYSAVDEDTLSSRLIYRNAVDYAVGHTCSAEWNEQDGKVISVQTAWVPHVTVKSTSSAGDNELQILFDDKSEPILNTKWLFENSNSKLVDGLRKLPNQYGLWIEKEKNKIVNLHDDYKKQANKHIKNAEHVKNRIDEAVDLIASDKNIEMAFRLANKAIMIQREWTYPDDGEMIWRPFQLAFILMTIPSTANEEHIDRETADLLWFPTGGGKTEAYLGLIAFILFLRRLRYNDAGAGVAAIMRYTMRLLTIQQFQRAASLICACEYLRKSKTLTGELQYLDFGSIPFSLGLWVGSDATPNDYKDAKKNLDDTYSKSRPDQLKYCPMHKAEKLLWSSSDQNKTIHAHCGKDGCLWDRNSTGLPLYTVDDAIYENRPSLVIGTIDKFAQLARKGETNNLFSIDNEYRRPDLIIQDELHLISGPLGTLTGIYEVAIDYLCRINSRPAKIIASTATIRQAAEQIKSLFNRNTCLFPPPVIDAGNSGFAVIDETEAGRVYTGISTAGRSAKYILQAVAASLLQSASIVDEEFKDDYWTLVSYFNSLRELGGALVLMQDDVIKTINSISNFYTESPRKLHEPVELTSRVNSSEIKEILDQLEKNYKKDGSCDILLASNMISVGVDVPRLGCMIVNGQPKGVSEYIQATSRVGRRKGGPGGLVVTIFNNAKARDRSHFETFNTWHSALYRDVEATSVTPFSVRAREKALHAVLIILARHLIPALRDDPSLIDDYEDSTDDFMKYIISRAEDIDSEEVGGVETILEDFLEKWIHNRTGFKHYWNEYSKKKSLMISAERVAEIKSRYGIYNGVAESTQNSMRNVESGVSFHLKEKLKNRE